MPPVTTHERQPRKRRAAVAAQGSQRFAESPQCSCAACAAAAERSVNTAGGLRPYSQQRDDGRTTPPQWGAATLLFLRPPAPPSPTDPVPLLPTDVLDRIFSLVPAFDRIRRCRAVSRAWRRFFSDPRTWQRLDFSAESGALASTPLDDFGFKSDTWLLRAQPAAGGGAKDPSLPTSTGILLAASRLARGSATVLDLSGAAGSFDWLRVAGVIRDNRLSLRVVRLFDMSVVAGRHAAGFPPPGTS